MDVIFTFLWFNCYMWVKPTIIACDHMSSITARLTASTEKMVCLRREVRCLMAMNSSYTGLTRRGGPSALIRDIVIPV